MFLVVEIQKNASGQVASLITQHSDYRDAQAKFHTILAAAAKSNLPRHGAAILHEDGHSIVNESYCEDGDD